MPGRLMGCSARATAIFRVIGLSPAALALGRAAHATDTGTNGRAGTNSLAALADNATGNGAENATNHGAGNRA